LYYISAINLIFYSSLYYLASYPRLCSLVLCSFSSSFCKVCFILPAYHWSFRAINRSRLNSSYRGGCDAFVVALLVRSHRHLYPPTRRQPATNREAIRASRVARSQEKPTWEEADTVKALSLTWTATLSSWRPHDADVVTNEWWAITSRTMHRNHACRSVSRWYVSNGRFIDKLSVLSISLVFFFIFLFY